MVDTQLYNRFWMSSPQHFNKENLATTQEPKPFKRKASSLAAIDYLVCISSDVFLQSHGGNFGHVMQVKGNNGLYYLYVITNFCNHAYFLMRFIQHHICERLKCVCVESSWRLRNSTIWRLHVDAVGKPVFRPANKSVKDVLAYPVPECMCQKPGSSM